MGLYVLSERTELIRIRHGLINNRGFGFKLRRLGVWLQISSHVKNSVLHILVLMSVFIFVLISHIFNLSQFIYNLLFHLLIISFRLFHLLVFWCVRVSQFLDLLLHLLHLLLLLLYIGLGVLDLLQLTDLRLCSVDKCLCCLLIELEGLLLLLCTYRNVISENVLFLWLFTFNLNIRFEVNRLWTLLLEIVKYLLHWLKICAQLTI